MQEDVAINWHASRSPWRRRAKFRRQSGSGLIVIYSGATCRLIAGSPTDHCCLHQACIIYLPCARLVMTSTQPQIARSSDGATSLVFLVQGRVVERSSSSPWRPEVFVAGIYPGCRVILLSAISARFPVTASCMHRQQRRSPEGENTLLLQSHKPFSLWKLLSQPLKTYCAVAGSATCPPVCDRSSPSDMPSIRPGSATRALLELQRRSSVHSAPGRRDIESQISMHTDCTLSGVTHLGPTRPDRALGTTVVWQLEVKYMHAVSFALCCLISRCRSAS